jgi:hypothetical protein
MSDQNTHTGMKLPSTAEQMPFTDGKPRSLASVA